MDSNIFIVNVILFLCAIPLIIGLVRTVRMVIAALAGGSRPGASFWLYILFRVWVFLLLLSLVWATAGQSAPYSPFARFGQLLMRITFLPLSPVLYLFVR